MGNSESLWRKGFKIEIILKICKGICMTLIVFYLQLGQYFQCKFYSIFFLISKRFEYHSTKFLHLLIHFSTSADWFHLRHLFYLQRQSSNFR